MMNLGIVSGFTRVPDGSGGPTLDAYATEINALGPLHWWKLDNTFDDDAGTRDGSAVGTVPFVSGIVNTGGAAQTSDDNFIGLGTSVASDFNGAAGISVTAVFKPVANDPGTLGTIFATGFNGPVPPPGFKIGRFIQTGIAVFYKKTGGGTANRFVTSGVSNGSVHHLVVTMDFTTPSQIALVVYLDGSAIITNTLNAKDGDTFIAGGPSYNDGIGGSQTAVSTPSNEEFNGVVQHVATYDRVLTPSEVSTLYSAMSIV